MRGALPVLIPALILPLAAAEPMPLPLRVQQTLRLPDAALSTLQRALRQAPPQADKAYWQALAAYARLGQTKDPALGARYLAEATQALAGRKDADSVALLGSLQGMAIGLHPERAMDLAPRALACFERARRLAPSNPRVRFFEAVHLFQTPEAFGGGPAVALPLLETTLALAEAEPEAAPWRPAWGKAETLAWLALAEARLGQMAQAKAYAARALQLDPDYGFVHAFVEPLLR